MFLSDHGTNFADNLEKAIGKPAGALYPGTMHIPLMMRHPEGKGAGLRLSPLVYTLDVPATVCAVAGPAPKDGVQGQSLIGLIEASGFEARDYLTCRYSNSVWYRDEKNWYFSNVHWENPRGCRWRTPEIPSEGYGTRSKRRSLKRSLMVVGGGRRLVRASGRTGACPALSIAGTVAFRPKLRHPRHYHSHRPLKTCLPLLSSCMVRWGREPKILGPR